MGTPPPRGLVPVEALSRALRPRNLSLSDRFLFCLGGCGSGCVEGFVLKQVLLCTARLRAGLKSLVWGLNGLYFNFLVLRLNRMKVFSSARGLGGAFAPRDPLPRNGYCSVRLRHLRSLHDLSSLTTAVSSKAIKVYTYPST